MNNYILLELLFRLEDVFTSIGNIRKIERRQSLGLGRIMDMEVLALMCNASDKLSMLICWKIL